MLREAGFTSINVDLIFGLPLQTAGSFARTIDDVGVTSSGVEVLRSAPPAHTIEPPAR